MGNQVEKEEIEKKIILKGVPNIEYDEILNITQYYLKVGKVWERFRRSESNNNVNFIKTIKTTIRPGVSLENETDISKNDYSEAVSMCESGKFQSRKISKIRHVKYTNDNLKWEIDKFVDITLVVAEIEIPSDDYEVIYPDFIKDNFIKDVTEWREFNNRRMAEVLFN